MASKTSMPPLWTIVIMVLLVGALVLVVLGSFSIQKEATNLDQANKGLQEIIFEIEAESSALKSELGEKNDALQAMQSALDASKGQAASGTEGTSALREQLAQATAALEHKEGELAEARTEAARQAETIATLRSASERGAASRPSVSARAESELAEARSALQATRNAQDEERERSKRLSAQLEREQAESLRQREATERARIDLERDRDALLAWVQRQQDSPASGPGPSHGERAAALEAELTELRRDRDALLTLVQTLQVQPAAADRAPPAAPSEERTAALESELTALREQLASGEATVAAAEGRVAEAAQDREALLAWVRKLEASSQQQGGQLSALAGEKEGLQKQLQEATRDRDALLARVDRVEGQRSRNAAGGTSAAEQERTLHQLEAALEEARALAATERAAAQRKLEDARRDREALLAWVDRLQTQPAAGSARPADAGPAPSELSGLASALTARLHAAGLGTVNVEPGRDRSLVIKLRNRMLFGAGSASISPGGVSLLERIASVLAEYPQFLVTVEGHTDNVPVGDHLGRRFPSNWELSSARAAEAARHLAQSGRVPPERLAAVGLADTRPVAGNETADGRRLNRRIEIRLSTPPT